MMKLLAVTAACLVWGSGDARAQLSGGGQAVDFGRLEVSLTGTRTLRLDNLGSQDVKVVDVTVQMDDGSGHPVPAPMFAVDAAGPFTVARGSGVALGLTFTPPSVGSFAATLTVDTVGYPPIVSPLTGVGVDPLVSVIPLAGDSIDLGQVALGAVSSPRQIVVVNNRPDVDRVVQVVTQPPFQVHWDAGVALPRSGGRATIDVSFVPVLAAEATGTVVVRLAGASAALRTVALRGEGVSLVVDDFGFRGVVPTGVTSCSAGGTPRAGVALTLGLLALALRGRRRRP